MVFLKHLAAWFSCAGMILCLLGCTGSNPAAFHDAGKGESRFSRSGRESARPERLRLEGPVFRVSATDSQERNPAVVPSLGDTVIVVFEVEPPGSKKDVDIYAQRVSAKGGAVWKEARPVATSAAEEAAPRAIPDGEGGAFVVFEAAYLEGRHAGDRDLAAQRISAGGELEWENGDRSVIVSGSKALERRPALAPDGRGGMVAAFERRYAEDENQADVDILAQRISSEGEKLWGEGKTSIPVSNTIHLETSPDVVADGRGGFLVVNEVAVEASGTVELVAQRLDETGKRTWQGGERPVVVSGSPLAERSPAAVSDGAGGLIVAFELHPLSGKERANPGIAVQRVSSAGDLLWGGGDDFVAVAAGTRLKVHSPILLAAGDGGAVIVFQGAYPAGRRKGDMDLYAQHVSGSGVPTWNRGKRPAVVAVSDAIESSPSAVRLEDGSVLVAFERVSVSPRDSGLLHHIGLQRLAPDGRPAWNKPRSFGKAVHGRLKHPVLAKSGAGSPLVVFEAELPTTAYSIDRDLAGRFLEGKTEND